MPDLQSLSRLVLKTDEWPQDGASLDELLHQALPMVQQVFPFITALRIFVPASSSNNLKVAARTDKDAGADVQLPERVIEQMIGKPLLNLGNSAYVIQQQLQSAEKYTIIH